MTFLEERVPGHGMRLSIWFSDGRSSGISLSMRDVYLLIICMSLLFLYFDDE